VFSCTVFRDEPKRRGVLFELMDVIVKTEHANSFAEFWLSSACTRQWHSMYKSLQERSFDSEGLRRLCRLRTAAKKAA
jgi:hypothetical protein